MRVDFRPGEGMLDITSKDMVEAFVLNSVRVCSIYDLLSSIAFKDIIYDIYIYIYMFFHRVLIF